jgi:hypothetical protein
MTTKQIQTLKASVLALRKIADDVLRQVEAAETPSRLKRRPRKTKEQGVAELTARILSGKRKPSTT